MAGGRPSKYSKELASKICMQIVMGKSLRTICSADEMPSVQTIFNWFDQHPEFLDQYARAKEEQADTFAEDIVDIADDGTNDFVKNKDGGYEFRGEHVQRSKLRVDTRKWLMSKFKAKKYGDKITQENQQLDKDGKPTDPIVWPLAPTKLDD